MSSNPPGSAALLRERNARRKVHIERAIREAQRAERSLSCCSPPHMDAVASGDLTPHRTCAGLRAAGTYGCLCPCHDQEVKGA
jgi:hypothetical protein